MTPLLVISLTVWLIALIGSTALFRLTRDSWIAVLGAVAGLMSLRSVILLTKSDGSNVEWTILAAGLGTLVVLFLRWRASSSNPNGTAKTVSGFRELAEAMPAYIWATGTDKGATYFNPTWLAFRGRTMEQEAGYGWTEGVHPDDLPETLEAYEDAFRDQTSFALELRVQRADGVYRWFLVSAAPRFVQDEFVGFIGSCHDFSEQREAESDLRLARDELEDRVDRRTTELERQYDRQSAIAELEMAINERHELQDVLNDIVRTVAERLPTTGGASAVLWDDRFDAFTIGCSTIPGQADGTAARVRKSGGATRWIVDNARPLIVRNVDDDPFGANPMLREEGMVAYVGIPMIDEDRVIGVLYALDNEPREYTQEDIHFIQTLANRATLALVRARLYADLTTANEGLEQRVRERTAELEQANSDLQREVIERRRAEEALHVSESRYRSLVENATEAIVVCDAATGLFVDANENAARLFKLDRKSLLDTGPVELSPTRQPSGPLSSQLFLDRVESVIEGEPAVFEWEHQDAEGRSFPCEVRLLRLPSRERILVRGVVVDISPRKDAELRHLEMERQLRQTQRFEAVATLAAGVAHDVNNSLTAILGYTSIARKAIHDTEHVAQSLDGIEHASSLTAAVAKSLLTFSRRTEGRRSPVDIGRLIHDEMPTLQTMIPASIELSAQAEPLKVWVEGDETQIRQVITNLVLNARDALPDGGHISIASHQIPDGRVELTVIDDGIGMTAEVQERIFDPFFSTKPREQGTGLGMAIVHSIVVDHGGEIELESAPDRGTTVRIRLQSTTRGTAPAPAVSAREIPLGAGQRILLAEDNGQVRSIMSQSLEAARYAVIPACDGAEALELLEECDFDVDLIVLDLDMPRIGGVDCLKRIRQRLPTVPAIFISGLSNPNLEDHDDLENVTLLQKPFRIPELTNAVAQTLSGRSIKPESQP